jgi:hypothetical protein
MPLKTQVAGRRNPCIRVRLGDVFVYDESRTIPERAAKAVTDYRAAISTAYGPERNAMRKYIENGM